jgi:hypothetical protein
LGSPIMTWNNAKSTGWRQTSTFAGVGRRCDQKWVRLISQGLPQDAQVGDLIGVVVQPGSACTNQGRRARRGIARESKRRKRRNPKSARPMATVKSICFVVRLRLTTPSETLRGLRSPAPGACWEPSTISLGVLAASFLLALNWHRQRKGRVKVA